MSSLKYPFLYSCRKYLSWPGSIATDAMPYPQP
jgi:hypothetical protein